MCGLGARYVGVIICECGGQPRPGPACLSALLFCGLGWETAPLHRISSGNHGLELTVGTLWTGFQWIDAVWSPGAGAESEANLDSVEMNALPPCDRF